jgi:hypothetical protein
MFLSLADSAATYAECACSGFRKDEVEVAFIGPPWRDMTPGMKTNDTLITITKPEEQEILPKPGDPEPHGPFCRAFSSATTGNR